MGLYSAVMSFIEGEQLPLGTISTYDRLVVNADVINLAEGLFTVGQFEDTLTGHSTRDMLVGGRGDDILNGLGGNDLMVGGTGNDTYFARPNRRLRVRKSWRWHK